MRFILIFFFSLISTISFSQKEKNTYVLIETTVGNMKVMLYNDTPKHRDNFIKLVRRGKYDETLFYRVIKNFVIQGGSSDSKNAIQGQLIGFGKPSPLDAEIKEWHFHKKGALCAPRQPNRVNVYKESDISQFYIVHGKKYTMKELDILEKSVNIPLKNRIIKRIYTSEIKANLKKLKEEKKVEEFRRIANKIKKDISFEWNAEQKKLILSEKQKKDYTTIGGVQHLDKEYTVFGEVVEGFDIIDKIANLKTDKNDRPFKDVWIKVRILK